MRPAAFPRNRPLMRVGYQNGAKLAARIELQLAEDARQVTLDRPCGDEERLCDLAVCLTVAGELGDPPLAGGQRLEARQEGPARARAGGAELGLRFLSESSGSGSVGCVEPFAQKLPRVPASVATPKHRAEVGECSGSLQTGTRAL